MKKIKIIESLLEKVDKKKRKHVQKQLTKLLKTFPSCSKDWKKIEHADKEDIEQTVNTAKALGIIADVKGKKQVGKIIKSVQV